MYTLCHQIKIGILFGCPLLLFILLFLWYIPNASFMFAFTFYSFISIKFTSRRYRQHSQLSVLLPNRISVKLQNHFVYQHSTLYHRRSWASAKTDCNSAAAELQWLSITTSCCCFSIFACFALCSSDCVNNSSPDCRFNYPSYTTGSVLVWLVHPYFYASLALFDPPISPWWKTFLGG